MRKEKGVLELKEKDELFLKAYVVIDRIFFPKKNVFDIIPGEFGILSVAVKTILEGELPPELSGSSNFGITPFITVKGPIPAVDLGGFYYFEGYLVETSRFGFQYEIKQLHKFYALSSLEEKRIFLESLFGETKCNLLFEHFTDPCEILEAKKIDELKKIKGIGDFTAKWLISTYEKNIDKSGDYIQLMNFGLTPSMVTKMQQVFKSTDTIIYLLQNNPYVFIDVIDGMGWDRADAIALNQGYAPNGENRIKAYIKRFLKDKANEEGHSWVYLDVLAEAVWGIAPTLPEEALRNFLQKWSVKTTQGVIPEFNKDQWLVYETDTRKIGLAYYRQLEEQIGFHLTRLLSSSSYEFTDEEIESAIKESEEIKQIEYTEEQRIAIKKCLSKNVCIISGSAGCGKTTVMHPITLLLKKKHKTFAQCSLSGKAASNLTEITEQAGYTIHRLLGYNGESKVFTYNSTNYLPYEVIILDELSLVGGEIFLDLIKAIESGSKLIMLGDPNQLEAIGLANLLKDCISSNIIPVARLTKIHRQAARSGIITESLKVSAGEQIVPTNPIKEIRGELQDLRLTTYSDSVLSHEYIMEEYRNFYCNHTIPASKISVIVPMRTRGEISCYSLNNDIQSLVNGLEMQKIVINTKEGGYELRLNDRILVTKNHYDIVDIEGESCPIFNGNTGFVEEICSNGREIIVNLVQQGRVVVPREYWRDIELGYAITCHKAQGSSNEYIIVGIDMSAYTLLSKEWVYTAITRAKQFCSVVGQISALRMSSKISRVTVKQTWLPDILRIFSCSDNYKNYVCENIKEILMLQIKELQENLNEKTERR